MFVLICQIRFLLRLLEAKSDDYLDQAWEMFPIFS